jgi:LacI family transcriptional regulator
MARSLIMSKTHTVGVLLPDLFGEFFSEVIRGIDQRARRSKYHLLVSSSHATSEELEAALQAMSGRIDGLIVMSPDLDAETLEANLPGKLPSVLLNCYLKSEVYDSINIDNYYGACEMVDHLYTHGHRRMALIRGASGNYDADERLRGFQAALEAKGLDASLVFEGSFTEESGYRAARNLLEGSPRPTAIFGSNDSMAIGAMQAVQEAGLSIPDDIAVVGFDNIPVARYVNPPLTSVHVSISDMGSRAVQMLLNAMEKNNTHERIQEVLPTTLAIRASSGGHPATENQNPAV